MSEHPFATWAARADSVADLVRLACVLEATAAKPGNVHPDAWFADLCYDDFVTAAGIAAVRMTQPDRTLGRRILETVRETKRQTGTNVNLGIAILMTPLVIAHETARPANRRSLRRSLRSGVTEVLRGIDAEDSRRVFSAIAAASAGGLELADRDASSRSMDATNPHARHENLMTAMRIAAPRDLIAMQYANDYRDLFDTVVPTLEQQIETAGDVVRGIVGASVRLLAWQPDSLIVRKNGEAIGREIQTLARQTNPEDPVEIAALDTRLRSDGNRLNPGTTADLIAAGLFVLLCESVSELKDFSR